MYVYTYIHVCIFVYCIVHIIYVRTYRGMYQLHLRTHVASYVCFNVVPKNYSIIIILDHTGPCCVYT